MHYCIYLYHKVFQLVVWYIVYNVTEISNNTNSILFLVSRLVRMY